MFISLHICLTLLYCCVKAGNPNSFKCSKWIVMKLFQMFTFTIYLRYLIEVYQYMLISSISELFETSKSSGFIYVDSFPIACIIVAFWVCFLIFAISHYLWVHYHPESIKGTLRELYNGMKANLGSRLYIILFMVRRIAFVALLLSLEDYLIFKLVAMLTYQGFYYAYLLRFRPFDDKKASIIDIIGETCFCYYLAYLMHFNKKEDWGEGSTMIMLGIIMMNNMVALVVFSGEYFL